MLQFWSNESLNNGLALVAISTLFLVLIAFTIRLLNNVEGSIVKNNYQRFIAIYIYVIIIIVVGSGIYTYIANAFIHFAYVCAEEPSYDLMAFGGDYGLISMTSLCFLVLVPSFYYIYKNNKLHILKFSNLKLSFNNLLLILLSLVLIYAAAVIIELLDTNDSYSSLSSLQMIFAKRYYLIVMYCFLLSTTSEIFFRGFLLDFIQSAVKNTYISIFIHACLFPVFKGVFSSSLEVLLYGLWGFIIYGFLYIKTNSLLPGILISTLLLIIGIVWG